MQDRRCLVLETQTAHRQGRAAVAFAFVDHRHDRDGTRPPRVLPLDVGRGIHPVAQRPAVDRGQRSTPSRRCVDELPLEARQSAEPLEPFHIRLAFARLEHADAVHKRSDRRTDSPAEVLPEGADSKILVAARHTCATCSSTRAAPSTRWPSTSATPTPASPPAPMRTASRRRRVPIAQAIRSARAAAARRPLVEPSAPKSPGLDPNPNKKVLRILRADAGTRTPDPIITSDVLYQLSYVGRRIQSSRPGPTFSPCKRVFGNRKFAIPGNGLPQESVL